MRIDVNSILINFFMGLGLKLLIVVILTFILLGLIKKYFNIIKNNESLDPNKRTLVPVLYQLTRIIVILISGSVILQFFNISATPLVALSSSIGLIIGVGAQQTVKDIINGFFILYEKQFKVGDHVLVSNISGIVTEIGLRTTTLSSVETGELVVIPNSLITIVQNSSTDNVTTNVDIAMPISIPFPDLNSQLIEEIPKIIKDTNIVTSSPNYVGVIKSDHVSYTIRISFVSNVKDSIKIETLIQAKVRELIHNLRDKS